MGEVAIRIDIYPVEWVQKGTARVRRFRTVARRGEDVLAEQSTKEGGTCIPGIVGSLVDLGVDMDTELDFYRGTTRVFLRATLADWLAYVRKRQKPRNSKKATADMEGEEE
jgi:hypothetical protein